MDLYAALKQGTSSKELENLFYKELEKANDRLKKEREEAAAKEAKKVRLDQSRKAAASALLTYFKTLHPEEEITITIDELANFIKTFEKNLTFRTYRSKADNDNKILKTFLKELF